MLTSTPAIAPDPQLNLSPEDVIKEFECNLDQYSYGHLFDLLNKSSSPIIILIVRKAIRAKEKSEPFGLSIDQAIRKIKMAENTKRKKFVRRIFSKWGLFSIPEIIKIYPDFSHDLLRDDLLLAKPSKKKSGKSKAKNDFRSRQLDKLSKLYYITDSDSEEHNKICERIAAFTIARLEKRDIILTVTLLGVKYAYPFNWNTAEKTIKDFHAQANSPGMTHENLHAFRKITFVK